MSSRGRRPLNAGNNGDSSSKGKDRNVDELSHGFAGITVESAQDDGQWEVYARKSKNRAGSSAAKPWGPQNSNRRPRGHSDVAQKPGVPNQGGAGRTSGNHWQTQTSEIKRPIGRGNMRPQTFVSGTEINFAAAHPVMRPPLEHGWNWQSRLGAIQSKDRESAQGMAEIVSEFPDKNNEVDEDEDGDSDAVDDSDDDLLSEDDDSDTSEKDHETRKNSKWFKKFFDILDGLTVEQMQEPERQWHCPACQGGPGAIDWYRGLQPLMTHAKTKGSKRMKVHRDFAELLNEELQRRGSSVVPAGEAYGKWKGIKGDEKDHQIVWPPMVVIWNTKLEQDENDKWVGMGNQELLDCFSNYAAAKARHSYGPKGHRGMSVLIFEASARGYLEAERLHRQFLEQGTDKDAWNRSPILFLPGGKRQLYGYLASKGDLELFNQHSQGKTKLKYEMRSYQEMVVSQIKQMGEDNQQLHNLKEKVLKEQRHSKALEESFGQLSERLRKTVEENRIVRIRTKTQHEEYKEEMNAQEQFFGDQIKKIYESRNAREEKFERLQQEEREKVKQQSDANSLSSEEQKQRLDEYVRFVKLQEKEIEEFVAERDELFKQHEENLAAMERRQHEERMQMEKEFDDKLTKLMEKHSPSQSKTPELLEP